MPGHPSAAGCQDRQSTKRPRSALDQALTAMPIPKTAGSARPSALVLSTTQAE